MADLKLERKKYGVAKRKLTPKGRGSISSEHDAADDQNYDALNFSRSLAGEFHDDINFALDKRGKSTNTLRT